MIKRLVIISLLIVIGFVILTNIDLSQVCFDEDCFKIEIADTPDQQREGLMYRQNLDTERGMLFVYENPGNYSFWMKNTLISLDIIWILDDEVVYIYENALPCVGECKVMSPDRISNYVLEINSGLAKEKNIKVGDKVDIII